MEKREYKIGGHITPEDKPEISKLINEWRKEALEPLPNELKKTPEEISFINDINKWLGEEFDELALPRVEVVPEQIHILTGDDFRQKFPHQPHALGVCSKCGKITINKDSYVKIDKSFYFRAITHEAIHSVQREGFFVNEQTEVYYVGMGYATMSYEDGSEHFRGLDEMMTETMAYELWSKHQDELKSKFGIDPLDAKVKGYFQYSLTRTMDILLQRMAEKTKEPEKEIWRKLKYGVFSGNMMHLREVEKAFGSGALRLLAAFQSCTKQDPDPKHEDWVAGMIGRYFSIDDEAERDTIASKILVESEYEAYKKSRTRPERMEKYSE